MIENNSDQKITVKAENVHPVAFLSKSYSPGQLKMSICSNEFLAFHLANLDYAHICGKQQSRQPS